MGVYRFRHAGRIAMLLSLAAFSLVPAPLGAQAPQTNSPAAPAWAQPGSATHTQVAPPADFHRPSRDFETPIGIFDGQSDIGGAVIPGSASYDATTGNTPSTPPVTTCGTTATSFAICGRRCPAMFRLRPTSRFPIPMATATARQCSIIRQSLDDDAKEAIVALHGAGMIQLAVAAREGCSREGYGVPRWAGVAAGRREPGQPGAMMARAHRHGEARRRFALYVSVEGEPMHQFGAAGPSAPGRAVLCGDWILLACAGQIGRRDSFQCCDGEFGRAGSLAAIRKRPSTVCVALPPPCRSAPTVFDWVRRRTRNHGLHPCSRSGNHQFPRHSVR